MNNSGIGSTILLNCQFYAMIKDNFIYMESINFTEQSVIDWFRNWEDKDLSQLEDYEVKLIEIKEVMEDDNEYM